MDKSSTRLLPSLVGTSVEFSFKKKLSEATSIEQNIRSTRKRIDGDVKKALEVGGELCVMLLAELTNHYLREPYYMAVRGAIEMRRYRPAVLDYLQLDVQKRAEKLQSLLRTKLRGDKDRDFKILITRYFLRSYPGRIKDFKDFLTREEYMLVV